MMTVLKDPVYIGELVWKHADAAMVSVYFLICWRCWSNAESV